MVYRVAFAAKVLGYLDTLEQTIRKRIIKKIDFYVESGDPLKFAKQLEGDKRGRYRFRIGDYRVIFEVTNNNKMVILYVLSIGHRKDIYRRGE